MLPRPIAEEDEDDSVAAFGFAEGRAFGARAGGAEGVASEAGASGSWISIGGCAGPCARANDPNRRTAVVRANVDTRRRERAIKGIAGRAFNHPVKE